jgi:CheY-like chemotaxis protein
LRELGYTVICARDGLEALELYERRHDVGLIILDLSMPRLSGRDTLGRLRALDPDVRVVVTSGHRLDREARRLLGEGAVAFVEKPYRLEEISRAVRAALDA